MSVYTTAQWKFRIFHFSLKSERAVKHLHKESKKFDLQ